MFLKRPLCLFCVSLIAGILLSGNCSFLVFLLFSAIGFLILVIKFNRFRKNIIYIFLALIFFITGGILFHNAEKVYTSNLEEFYGKPILLRGYIDSEIERDRDKIQFTYKTDKITYNDKTVSAKLIINSYDRGESCFNNGRVGYRTRLSFSAVIKKPKAATNPGGFNNERYLASRGISGTVNILNNSDIEIAGTEPGGWINKLGYKIKNTVLEIVEYCLGVNQAGLLSGMIIGYKDGLDENAYQAFSRAGLTHIMVASGMNVAFIILPLMFLFNKLRLGNKVSSLITIFVLVLFVFVTGFSASVVRAVLMGVIILTGKMIMRETEIYTSISAAAIVLLAINPYLLYDIGFQLSFTATLSLVMFYPAIKKAVTRRYIPEFASDTLAATLAAQLGVVPVTLYYFNNLSIISVVSNLLVVPLVQIITIIGFTMVFAGLLNIHLAVLIGYVNNSFLSFILFVTEMSAKVPFASLKLITPPVWLVLVYYTGILYLFIARKRLSSLKCFSKLKWAAVGLSSIVLLISYMLPKPMTITFLDVGQGDSAFIKTAFGKKVLIDGGGREAGSKSSFDIGESVMVPYILDQGTKSIDIIIASHGHSDHTEGLEAVLKEIKVGMVILPDTDGNGFEKIKTVCSQKGIRIAECKKGDFLRLDKETRVQVLNPLEFSKDSLSQQSLNNSSLVLKLIYRNTKVLFVGDSELPVEERLLETNADVRADLLKVGHHGSITSSSEAFISRVSPKYAVISVGERNRFGHPSQFVVDRLEERNIKLYRTDQCGAVTVTSYGRDFTVNTMLP